jgi:zinc protease
LPNGLRLIVRPEHVSRTVSVYGMVRQVADTQEAPGKEGVASLVGELFSYGTDHHDRLGLQKALDDIAAQENAGTGFSLKVLTPEFEHGMALLAENELHPSFPADAFTIVRRQEAQGLAGLLQSPDYLFKRAVTKAVVPEGDPQMREPTPDSLMALKLDDVKSYYASTYRPDLTTIVVVGDVTPEDARRVVEANFGSWTAQGPTPKIDLPSIPASKPSAAHVPDSSNLQDTVALVESVTLPITNYDRYDLMLGNTILGGGFSSRLFQDLRVKTGYVYSVSSQIDFSRTRSDYSVSFGADPDKVVKARMAVIQDIKALQTTPVTDAELTRAKAQMLRRIPMQRASVDAIAALDLRLVDLGLPLDAMSIAAQHYYDATAAKVQTAFKTWLRPDDLSEVVKGPAVSQ